MAVISDPHLTTVPNTVPNTAQEACLDWALAALGARRPDVVVVAGDVTAAGAPEAALVLRRRLEQSGLPWLITPGNSDLRQPRHHAVLRHNLAGPSLADYPPCRVLLLDSSTGVLTPEARGALTGAAGGLEGRALVLVTHLPPELLAPESRQWLQAWAEQARPSLIVAGHTHRDQQLDFAGVPMQVVRGLDPDKAIGGPPAVAMLELEDGKWRRGELTFPGGSAAQWLPAERQELAGLLGLGCSRDAPGALLRAAAGGVGRVELRAMKAAAAPDALQESLLRWREAGGHWLSWHMPDVPWRDGAAPPNEVSDWQDLLRLGLECDLQALTLHVPRVPVGMLEPGTADWDALADTFCRLLEPVVRRGIPVAIENMHMTAHEAPDQSRRYGYLPAECLAWVEELRSRLGHAAVGMLLDIGHARNNAPYSEQFTLGAWYAMVGRHTVAYHLHQVVSRDGKMANHQPFTGLYGPLISCESFLWAWRTRQLNHAPVFLEITDAQGQLDSLRVFRDFLQ